MDLIRVLYRGVDWMPIINVIWMFCNPLLMSPSRTKQQLVHDVHCIALLHGLQQIPHIGCHVINLSTVKLFKTPQQSNIFLSHKNGHHPLASKESRPSAIQFRNSLQICRPCLQNIVEQPQHGRGEVTQVAQSSIMIKVGDFTWKTSVSNLGNHHGQYHQPTAFSLPTAVISPNLQLVINLLLC
jgi:hypothetical protein